MLFSLRSKKKNSRRVGDRHRDRREWNAAADAYRQHLRTYPDDTNIWVQLGHCAKEDGKFDEAESAYRKALELSPENPDTLLHLAHHLKTQGQREDALVAFRSLFALTPRLDVVDELRQLVRARASEAVVVREGAVLFAIEDFFRSFEAHSTFTGIQRVEAAAVLAAIADESFDSIFFVHGPLETGNPSYFAVDPDALREILAHAGAASENHDGMRARIMEARMSAQPVSFGLGHSIVLLGPFWEPENKIEQYVAAKERGARLIVYVHDIIPLTHPEFCEQMLVNAFWRGLASMIHLADLILTNSDHTRRELGQLLEANRCPPIRMETVALVQEDSGAKATLPSARAGLPAKDYVAYVSTIEARKNHAYVVEAWRRMIAAGVDVPLLLFVGRPGWKTDPLMKDINESRDLKGRIKIIHGLSDAELSAVYGNAKFTVFTSFVEGWGLPVGESLAHGTPCVASRVASLPEVGGDFVDYVDPYDIEDGVRVFRRLIEDGAYLAERRRAIEEDFSPRTWADFGRDLIRVVEECVRRSPPPRPVPTIQLAEDVLFDPVALATPAQPPADYFRHPMGLALAGDFHEYTAEGAWMRRRSALFTFGTRLGEGEEIILFLDLGAAPAAVGQRYTVSLADASGHIAPRWLRLTPGTNRVRLAGRVGAAGQCAVSIHFGDRGQPVADDLRGQGIALRAVGYCRKDQWQSRSALRERIIETDSTKKAAA